MMIAIIIVGVVWTMRRLVGLTVSALASRLSGTFIYKNIALCP